MPWFKVDDSFTFHPKVVALTPAAGWLWVRAGAWAAQQLTDGHVPSRIMRALDGTRGQADELVQAGLWLPADDGWVFHDWDVYQPSRESVLAERASARERQRKARELAKAKRDNKGSHGVSHGVTNGEVLPQSRSPRPDPTRPDPTPKESGRRKPEKPIPDDWSPNDAHKTKATEKNLDLARAVETYKRHALANHRRLRDWDQGFHMWLAKEKPSTPARAGDVDYDAWDRHNAAMKAKGLA